MRDDTETKSIWALSDNQGDHKVYFYDGKSTVEVLEEYINSDDRRSKQGMIIDNYCMFGKKGHKLGISIDNEKLWLFLVDGDWKMDTYVHIDPVDLEQIKECVDNLYDTYYPKPKPKRGRKKK